jgi:DNA-binding NtrC family response regulator
VDLEQEISAGRFRQDLYFRLQEISLRLPPLRERAEDIRSLAEHFVALYSRRFDLPVSGITEEAIDILGRYDWPGNIRELENAMKSAVVLAGDLVGAEHLPTHVLERTGARAVTAAPPRESEERLQFELEVGLRDAAPLDLKAFGARASEQAERSLLEALIRSGIGSGAHLAKRLSVDPKTLRQKLRRYGLGGIAARPLAPSALPRARPAVVHRAVSDDPDPAADEREGKLPAGREDPEGLDSRREGRHQPPQNARGLGM